LFTWAVPITDRFLHHCYLQSLEKAVHVNVGVRPTMA
jgi:hypothetical protein